MGLLKRPHCPPLGRRTLVLPHQRDDASWTGHLKRKRCIMRYCVKASESFASQ